ncbi:MAG: hypothetical protein FJ303_14210 [Planctomycetes bacterium]|nr:hypothetical protein [Planctomycetota bacterium]
MNVLNEDSPDDQRRWLLAKRVRVQKIGRDIGRSGLKDDGIIPCLLQLNRPTFFTLYQDFCDRRLCHQEYCIVYLEMDDDVVADYCFGFHGLMDAGCVKRTGPLIGALHAPYVYPSTDRRRCTTFAVFFDILD